MKNFKFYAVFLIALLIAGNMLIAQDNIPKPLGEDEKKPDIKKETKEVYDLNLMFSAGMKFKEVASVNLNMNVQYGEETLDQSMLTEIGVNFEVIEVENNNIKKAKLTFDEIKVTASSMGQEFDASQPGGFFGIATFDKDGKMKFESTSDDFPEDLKSELENQDFIGFHPPTKGVAIDEEWVVDPKFMKEQLKKYSVDNVETKMKLEKVTSQGEGETAVKIATIKVNITFSGSDAGSGLNMKGTADGVILFDLTNHRLVNRKINMKLEGGTEDNVASVSVTGTITMDDKFTYEGQLQTRPTKEEEIKPKGDDDE